MGEEHGSATGRRDIDWSRIRDATDEELDSPGLYMIACKKTGQFYVGATRRPIIKRANEHFRALEKGNHTCWPLQDLFNVYGADCFTILVCPAALDSEALKEEERVLLRLAYGAKRLLNVRHVGINLKRRDDAFGEQR